MRKAQHVLLKLAVIVAVLTAVSAVCAALGARFDVWGFGTGFAVLRWSVYVAAGALVLAAVSLIMALGLPDRGKRLVDVRYVVVLLIGSAVIGVPYAASREFKQYPTVADATTNISDPPQFVALVPVREKTAQNPLAYRRDEAAGLQRQYFPELDSITTTASAPEVIQQAQAIAGQMGMDVVEAAPAGGRLEATDTTFWFGFEDDVVIRARPESEGTTRIDIRSASRVGYLDGGLNAKRVKRIQKELGRKLATVSDGKTR